MIRCPNTLKAGPYLYRLGLEAADDELPYASIHLISKEIVFSPNSSPVQALVSLIHEYLHAHEEISSLYNSSSRLTHDQIRWASNVVVDLLQQLGLDCELDITQLSKRAIPDA